MSIQTINPATGDLIQTYVDMSDDEVEKIIHATYDAFLQWRQLNVNQRAIPMKNLANILKQQKKECAILIANEMGKPLKQGIAEIEKCIFLCEHYAENSADYLQDKIVKTEMSKSYVTYQPLGVIFAIMPWNFPFWQVFRFAVPTLMAGNAAILKHAPISTGTALTIEAMFMEARFLENVFRTLIITEDKASNVIAHSKVAAVTLTGSTRAGKIVGAAAAKELKKSVLELGGSDPYLILEDADLALAAKVCVISRMNNAGQSCIAAKRIIVVYSIQEKFLALMKEELKKYQIGDPLDDNTQCGPLARKDLRDKVHEQVQKSIEKGAKLIMGGEIPQHDGFYYLPTLLINIQKGMPAYHEEIFGPVISMITAKDEEEAISIANDTPYGLGAAIFTKDIARGEKIAVEKIQAGTCVLNTLVASDPRLPFGGIKHSGYGRELSVEGIRSFMNVKTVHLISSSP